MQIYLVGGAVRDELLGRTVVERDYVVVGSTLEEMTQAGFTQVGKDFPVFLHPETKEEYALARTERKQGQGYTGFICDFSKDITLEEDLRRRDLTINAIAKTEDGQLIDPYGGLNDLNKKVIRHVSEAFAEDPLRILRIARFAARYHYLDFTIASETLSLVKEMIAKGELTTLTSERIWLECEKSLNDGAFAHFLNYLFEFGALDCVLASASSHWTNQFYHQLRGQIAYAAKLKYPIEVAFAMLAQIAEPSIIEKMSLQLKLSNQCKLALTIARQAIEPAITSLHPDSIAQLLLDVDSYRRTERFELLLQIMDTVACGQAELSRLRIAFAEARAVCAQTFIAQGLKGPEIKIAVAKARLRIIQQQLN